MKKINRILICIYFMASTSIASAQSALTIEASQQYTSFSFFDTKGTQLNKEYSGIFTGTYRVGYRYTTGFGLIVRAGVGMRNAGAMLVYDDMNYSWKLQYADAKLGLGYTYKIGRVNPYFTASGYYSYLLRGTQILNNKHFNITQSGLLSRTDYGAIFALGVEIRPSHYISSYLEFNYLWGLQNIEMDAGQKASNFAFGLTLGVAFAIN